MTSRNAVLLDAPRQITGLCAAGEERVRPHRERGVRGAAGSRPLTDAGRSFVVATETGAVTPVVAPPGEVLHLAARQDAVAWSTDDGVLACLLEPGAEPVQILSERARLTTVGSTLLLHADRARRAVAVEWRQLVAGETPRVAPAPPTWRAEVEELPDGRICSVVYAPSQGVVDEAWRSSAVKTRDARALMRGCVERLIGTDVGALVHVVPWPEDTSPADRLLLLPPGT